MKVLPSGSRCLIRLLPRILEVSNGWRHEHIVGHLDGGEAKPAGPIGSCAGTIAGIRKTEHAIALY